jgi:hypothetical protein
MHFSPVAPTSHASPSQNPYGAGLSSSHALHPPLPPPINTDESQAVGRLSFPSHIRALSRMRFPSIDKDGKEAVVRAATALVAGDGSPSASLPLNKLSLGSLPPINKKAPEGQNEEDFLPARPPAPEPDEPDPDNPFTASWPARGGRDFDDEPVSIPESTHRPDRPERYVSEIPDSPDSWPSYLGGRDFDEESESSPESTNRICDASPADSPSPSPPQKKSTSKPPKKFSWLVARLQGSPLPTLPDPPALSLASPDSPQLTSLLAGKPFPQSPDPLASPLQMKVTPPDSPQQFSPLDGKPFDFRMLTPWKKPNPELVTLNLPLPLTELDHLDRRRIHPKKISRLAAVFAKVIKKAREDAVLVISKYLEPQDIRSLFLTESYFWKMRKHLLRTRGDYVERIFQKALCNFDNIPAKIKGTIFDISSGITRLHLQDCPINQLNMNGICSYFENLQDLELSNCGLDNSQLVPIKKLTSLIRLDLSVNPGLSNGLCNLAECVNLQVLSLFGCNKAQDTDLYFLKELKYLQSLDISDCSMLTDGILKYLPPSNTLQVLSLSSNQLLTDQGLLELPKFINLRELYLYNLPNITDEGMRSVAQLVHLLKLNLSCAPKLTDKGLSSLAKLTKLKGLDITFLPHVSIQTLQVIAGLVDLEWLSLNHNTLPAHPGLIVLRKLPKLKTLGLENTNLTDDGLYSLRKISGLAELYIKNSSQLTANGFQKFLKSIHAQKVTVHADDYLYDIEFVNLVY